MRILVIEDDSEMLAYLKKTLERECFIVDTALDGEKGSYLARVNEYDLIILDNVLPKKTGFEICKEIRTGRRVGTKDRDSENVTRKNTPILLLSIKSEVSEKIKHLDAGADDYLTKPYSHEELLSRIRALTRRKDSPITPTIFHAGKIVLDSNTNDVHLDGEKIYLTRKEFVLLELLMRNKGNAVSRGKILEHVWELDHNPLSKTVETHVLNLRKKIGDLSKELIVSVSGRGYKIVE